MKKTMVITGATKGLGKSLYNEFQKNYSVISVARSGADFNGDLTDQSFRQKLIHEINPDIVINNAGTNGSPGKHVQTLLLNFVAVVDLTKGFAEKMKSGHIINISSVSAGLGLVYTLPESDLDYALSKKVVSDFSQLYQFIQNKNVKISSIEPGFIMTDMSQISQRYKEQNPNDYITKRKIKPMDPKYISSVVEWILNQPSDVVVSSIRLMNQCHS